MAELKGLLQDSLEPSRLWHHFHWKLVWFSRWMLGLTDVDLKHTLPFSDLGQVP